jgi:hypothetical protein
MNTAVKLLFYLFSLAVQPSAGTRNRQISVPPVGFEPKIAAGERPWTCATELNDYVLMNL